MKFPVEVRAEFLRDLLCELVQGPDGILCVNWCEGLIAVHLLWGLNTRDLIVVGSMQ